MSTPDGRENGLGQSRHAPPGYELALSSDAEPPAHVIRRSALQTGARPPAFDNPNDSRGRRSASVAKEKRDDSYILA